MGAGQHSIPTNDGVLSLSDDDIEAALEEAAQAAAEELDNEGEQGGDGVQLSADASGTLRSFASGLEERDVTIRGMQAKLAGSDWERERLSLSNAGVPKPLLDEAEKVLKFPGESVVSLSDEDGREFTHDSRSTIRRMLELSKGIIDLSDVPGTSADTLDLSADGEVTDDKLAELAEKQGGIS